MGKEILSELRLENVVFDHIEFDRKDFKKTNADPEIRLKVQVGENEDSVHRTNLICIITKKDEYDINISLSGYFTFQSDSSLDEKKKKDIIENNTVSILMPYLRSEITLLTTQPDMEPVVLPVINVRNLMKNDK